MNDDKLGYSHGFQVWPWFIAHCTTTCGLHQTAGIMMLPYLSKIKHFHHLGWDDGLLEIKHAQWFNNL